MMKSSWIGISALAVALLGLLSAILLSASNIGLALLAVTLTAGAAAILIAAQNILNELAQIHKGMVSFNSEESRDFVAAVDSSYLSTDMLNRTGQPEPAISKPLPPAKGNAPLSILATSPINRANIPDLPVEPPSTPASQSNYQQFGGLSLSSPAPAKPATPVQSQPHSEPPAPVNQPAALSPAVTTPSIPASKPAPLPPPPQALQPVSPVAPPKSAPMPAPMPASMKDFEETLGHGSESQPASGMVATSSAPKLPSKPHQFIPPPAPVQEIENTQSFDMPTEANPVVAEHGEIQQTLSAAALPMPHSDPDSTLGFADSVKAISTNQSGFTEPVRPKSASHPVVEPKGRNKIRKRYSTFAGLSLNDTGSMNRNTSQQHSNHLEEQFAPPPPPPPPMESGKPGKEKKRYSTFAGLALNDRGARQSAPATVAPPPEPPAPKPAPRAGNPLSINPMSMPPSNATNLNFTKQTDGLSGQNQSGQFNQSNGRISEPIAPVTPPPPPSRGGMLSIAPPPPARPIQPAPASSMPAAPAPPAPPQGKGSRKRYQTFMGLSLSKTPQPIKKLEEVPPDSTAPLPASLGATASSSYSGGQVESHSMPSPTAINMGQQGNLVDGFCSLCGSPQAAGNEYSGATSEPEFCWYCGAKLRTA